MAGSSQAITMSNSYAERNKEGMSPRDRVAKAAVATLVVMCVFSIGCTSDRSLKRVLTGPGGFTSPTKGDPRCPRSFHGFHPTAWHPLEQFGAVVMPGACASAECTTVVGETQVTPAPIATPPIQTATTGTPPVQTEQQTLETGLLTEQDIPYWFNE